MTFPIIPLDQLVQQWRNQWMCHFDELHPAFGHDFQQYVIAQAAQWGWEQRGAVSEAELQQRADQELEAIFEMVGQQLLPEEDRYLDGLTVASIRATRRPKPSSLKEQAQAELDRLIALIPAEGAMAMAEPIRRALEALPND